MNLHSNNVKASKVHAQKTEELKLELCIRGKWKRWQEQKLCRDLVCTLKHYSVWYGDKCILHRAWAGVRNKRPNVIVNICSDSLLARSDQNKCFKACPLHYKLLPDCLCAETEQRQICDSKYLFFVVLFWFFFCFALSCIAICIHSILLFLYLLKQK